MPCHASKVERPRFLFLLAETTRNSLTLKSVMVRLAPHAETKTKRYALLFVSIKQDWESSAGNPEKPKEPKDKCAALLPSNVT